MMKSPDDDFDRMAKAQETADMTESSDAFGFPEDTSAAEETGEAVIQMLAEPFLDPVSVPVVELTSAAVALLKDRDLTISTIKTFRHELATHFGFDKSAFGPRRDEIASILEQVVKEHCAKQSSPHHESEDLGAERDGGSRSVYNITFTHPDTALASDGLPLAAPRERHQNGEWHFHVGVVAGRCKSERRVREVDLWPIVISQSILVGPDCAERIVRWAKRNGGPAMVDFSFQNFAKLPELVARSWKFETVEHYIEQASKSRMDLLHDALNGACVCKGNEGKSFLFEPLAEVFGHDGVFTNPAKGACPLLGLETHRVVLLDDWRFNEEILGYNLQLLWFEGKPFIVARPQNQHAGHLRYQKDDPVFITTLEADIHALKRNIQQGDIDMMLERLLVFQFQVKLGSLQKVPACGHCFANLLLKVTAPQEPRPPQSAPDTEQAQAEAPITPRNEPPSSSSTRLPQGPTGSTPAAKRTVVMDWLVADVIRFFDEIELGHLAPAFEENGVDGAFLAELSPTALISELGLTRWQAKKLKGRLPR
ncbi:unnamed protein product [Polarella glacialis]|uniref:SAM domain-containing protein n=1 Tax=Polarella glacialis TaxID=89957 RepID=A0A813GYL2_POLGL|nr:unnamed protein product [Polarella glacialis]